MGKVEFGRLIERDDAAEQIERQLACAPAGEGSSILVEGEAGIGKTELVSLTVESARERSFEVLQARGGELEREIPFGVVRQLYEKAVIDRAAEKGGLLTGAASPAAQAIAVEPTPSEAETASIFHGLYRLAANLAEEQPLLLAVDDAHWADGVSLRYLAYLAHRIEALPILLVLAARSHVPGAAETLAVIESGPSTEKLTPEPLTERGVAKLVHRRYASGAVRAFCRACHEAGGGNPFLTTALLEALAEDGVAPDADGAERVRVITPSAIKRSVVARLARLEPEARELAMAVAVLGRSAELRDAAALAEVDHETAAAAAGDLGRAGLVDDVRPLAFVHPVVREVIYAELETSRRLALHMRAAQLLADARAEPEVVGAHLLNTEVGTDQWVVDRLRQAAERASARGAHESAADYLQRARREAADVRERAEVTHALGAAEALAGRRTQSIDHLHEALELSDEPEEAAAISIELARAQLQFADLAGAVRTLDRARLATAEAGLSELELVLDAELAAVRTTLTGSPDRVEREPLELRVSRLSGTGPHEQTLIACLGFARAKECEPADEVVELLEPVLAPGGLLETQGPISIALVYTTIVLLFADRFERAEREIEGALERARRMNAIWALGAHHYLRGLLAFLRGRLEDAEHEARTSVELAEGGGYGVGVPPSLALMVRSMAELGEQDRAWEELERRGMTGPLAPLSTSSFLFEARGMVRSARGEYREALSDLEEAGRRYADWGVVNPSMGHWRSAAALCAGRVGASERADELVTEALELVLRFGAPRAIGHVQRAAALVQSDPARQIGGLRDSVETLSASGAALELARSEVELGAALRRTGARREARDPLRAGLDRAFRLGARPLVERAETELRASGARPRNVVLSGVESLTPSEGRVAALAAAGRSNREIAEELFITRKTVEYHLTGIYRKLNVGTREELAPALDSAGPPHP